MISGAQIRAARALLGWSAAALADAASIGSATIQRFESQDDIPSSKAGTIEKIKAALESEGIEFLGDPVKSPGVQLNRPGVARRKLKR